jgi:hypothetical protein
MSKVQQSKEETMSSSTTRKRKPRRPTGSSSQAFLVCLALIAVPVVVKAWPLS